MIFNLKIHDTCYTNLKYSSLEKELEFLRELGFTFHFVDNDNEKATGWYAEKDCIEIDIRNIKAIFNLDMKCRQAFTYFYGGLLICGNTIEIFTNPERFC